MLYNAVLVSAVQQSESAVCIHISPYSLPLEPPSHPPYPTLVDSLLFRWSCNRYYLCLECMFIPSFIQAQFRGSSPAHPLLSPIILLYPHHPSLSPSSLPLLYTHPFIWYSSYLTSPELKCKHLYQD